MQRPSDDLALLPWRGELHQGGGKLGVAVGVATIVWARLGVLLRYLPGRPTGWRETVRQGPVRGDRGRAFQRSGGRWHRSHLRWSNRRGDPFKARDSARTRIKVEIAVVLTDIVTQRFDAGAQRRTVGT